MLTQLVDKGLVSGWDDPRMPTLAGLRRRGYTPQAIRNFCDRVGVAKNYALTEMALLEHSIREDLNKIAPRVMAVLRPLKVVIENYPEGIHEDMTAVNNPEDPSYGTRIVPMSREIYIEREDFEEDPPRKFYRLAPGREVRLRYGYFIKCVGVIKDDDTGEIVGLRCTYDHETRGGSAPDGRKVKATLHWVSAPHSIVADVRLYSPLIKTNVIDVDSEPGEITANINSNSVEILRDCRVEPSLTNAELGRTFQFERQGYFCVDSVDSTRDKLVFNRTVTLRDQWNSLKKNSNKVIRKED